MRHANDPNDAPDAYETRARIQEAQDENPVPPKPKTGYAAMVCWENQSENRYYLPTIRRLHDALAIAAAFAEELRKQARKENLVTERDKWERLLAILETEAHAAWESATKEAQGI